MKAGNPRRREKRRYRDGRRAAIAPKCRTPAQRGSRLPAGRRYRGDGLAFAARPGGLALLRGLQEVFDQRMPDGRAVVAARKVVAFLGERSDRAMGGVAAGAVVGRDHLFHELWLEERIVCRIDPEQRRARRTAVFAGSLDQRAGLAIADTWLVAAAAGREGDHRRDARGIEARQRDRAPCPGGLADDDRAVLLDERLLAHIVDRRLDIRGGFEAAAHEVGALAAAVFLGPAAAGRAVATTQRQNH